MEVDPPMPPPPAPVLNLPYGALDVLASRTCGIHYVYIVGIQIGRLSNLGYDNMETIPMDVELMNYESPQRTLDATPAKSDVTPVIAGTSEPPEDSATHIARVQHDLDLLKYIASYMQLAVQEMSDKKTSETQVDDGPSMDTAEKLSKPAEASATTKADEAH